MLKFIKSLIKKKEPNDTVEVFQIKDVYGKLHEPVHDSKLDTLASDLVSSLRRTTNPVIEEAIDQVGTATIHANGCSVPPFVHIPCTSTHDRTYDQRQRVISELHRMCMRGEITNDHRQAIIDSMYPDTSNSIGNPVNERCAIELRNALRQAGHYDEDEYNYVRSQLGLPPLSSGATPIDELYSHPTIDDDDFIVVSPFLHSLKSIDDEEDDKFDENEDEERKPGESIEDYMKRINEIEKRKADREMDKIQQVFKHQCSFGTSRW